MRNLFEHAEAQEAGAGGWGGGNVIQEGRIAHPPHMFLNVYQTKCDDLDLWKVAKNLLQLMSTEDHFLALSNDINNIQ
jgi:hypothetical protein